MRTKRATRAATKAEKNLRDASDEVVHRAKASGEHIKRRVAGKTMTTGQKMRSALNEAADRTIADVDRAKRKMRGG